MKNKKKKVLLMLCSLFAIVIISTLCFTFKAYAATGNVTDYDWGYMWWLSNSSTKYFIYNGAYQKNFSDDPKYPDDKYSRWCYDEGPIGSSGWKIDTARGIRWAADVNLKKGVWPYGMPIYQTNPAEYSSTGWWDKGILNHYRKPCVVYYRRTVTGSLTMSTKNNSYDMGSNNSVDITVSMIGYVPIDRQRIRKPRLDISNYSINTTGKNVPLGTASTGTLVTDINTNDFSKSKNPESYTFTNDFTITVNASDLKEGNNIITVNGEFAIPAVTGINDETTDTSYIKASLPITVKLGQTDSTLPNLTPTNVTILDSNNNKVNSVKVGEDYTALVDVENNGGVDATATNTALYLGDNYSSNVPTPLITKSGNTSIKIPFKAQSSVQEITAEVNYQNTIKESCYTDNRYTLNLNSGPSQIGPTVSLNAPSTVIAGDDALLSASAYTKDTTATSLTANITLDNAPGINGTNPISGTTTTFAADSADKSTSVSGSVWFSDTGIYTANADAVDSNNSTGYAEPKQINVIAPQPEINIATSGSLKENRKVIVDASSSYGGSKRFPIDWTSAKWTITSINGASMNDVRIQTHTTGSTDGSILYDPSQSINKPLDGLQAFDMAFKKAGQYQITCTAKNTYGNSGTKTITLTIAEDAAPIVKFSTPSYILRDPNDTNSNGYAQATINATDDGTVSNGSYSPDGDIIGKRAWVLCFDANNNGTYKDDKWYLINNDNSLTYIGDINAAQNISLNTYGGNMTSITVKTMHVGWYNIEEIVREDPGQEYIPQFFSISERKIGSSSFPK